MQHGASRRSRTEAQELLRQNVQSLSQSIINLEATLGVAGVSFSCSRNRRSTVGHTSMDRGWLEEALPRGGPASSRQWMINSMIWLILAAASDGVLLLRPRARRHDVVKAQYLVLDAAATSRGHVEDDHRLLAGAVLGVRRNAAALHELVLVGLGDRLAEAAAEASVALARLRVEG